MSEIRNPFEALESHDQDPSPELKAKVMERVKLAKIMKEIGSLFSVKMARSILGIFGSSPKSTNPDAGKESAKED
jgi:hypothetical protein